MRRTCSRFWLQQKPCFSKTGANPQKIKETSGKRRNLHIAGKYGKYRDSVTDLNAVFAEGLIIKEIDCIIEEKKACVSMEKCFGQ